MAPRGEGGFSPEKIKESESRSIPRSIDCTHPSEKFKRLLDSLRTGAFVAASIGVVYSEQAEAGGMSTAEQEQRMDAAYHQAGQDLRVNETLIKEFDQQAIDAVADALESFSSKDFFTSVASESGVSEDALVKLSKTKGAFVYSDGTLDQFVAHVEPGLKPSDSRYTVEREWGRTATGMNSEGIICLNVSGLVGASEHSLKKLNAATTTVLYHESMHSFPNEYEMHADEKHYMSTARNLFYEGSTEFLSRILLNDEHKIMGAFQGYDEGPTAAAAVVYESLSKDGQRAFWDAYVEGDFSKVSSVYNKTYGDHTLENILDAPSDLVISPQAKVQTMLAAESGLKHGPDELRNEYASLALLDRTLDPVLHGDPEITDRANKYLQNGNIIVPIRGTGVQGVVFSGKDISRGTLAGMLRIESQHHGTKIVILSAVPHTERTSPLDLVAFEGSNAAYLFLDPEDYSSENIPLQEQDRLARSESTGNMLRKSLPLLEDFRRK